MVHNHLPSAFMVGVFFLPIGAVDDKPGRSSFAHTVMHLKARTSRLDPQYAGHMDRMDMCVVVLYVPGDVENYEGRGGTRIEREEGFPRGVVRYFDVTGDYPPPENGRPRIETTLDLEDIVDIAVVRSKRSGVYEHFRYADAEED